MSKRSSIILSIILLVSMVAIPIGTVTAQQGPPTGSGPGNGGGPAWAGGPPDHAAVNSVDVRSSDGGPPSSAGPPTDPAAWGISSSQHSEDMDAEIVLDDEGNLERISVTDDRNHEGREVSVSLNAIEQTVDEIPDQIRGYNSETGAWTSEVRITNGSVVVDVPHFSTNEIAFTGSLEISADPAVDGDRFEYAVRDAESVSDATLSLTGETATNWQNTSASDLQDGDTVQLDINGNADPTGPSPAGEPTVTITGAGGSYNIVDSEGDGDAGSQKIFLGDDTYDDVNKLAAEFSPSASGDVTAISVNIAEAYGSEYDPQVDVYIDSGAADTTYGEGTLVASSWSPNWTTGQQSFELDNSYNVTAGETYEVEFVPTASDNDGSTDNLRIATDISADQDRLTTNSGGGYATDSWADITFWGPGNTSDPKIDIDGDGSTEVSVSDDLSLGDSVTREVSSLSVGDHTAVISTAKGAVNADFRIQERTQTTDPSIDINSDSESQTVSHSGTLDDGETVDLSDSIDESIIRGNVSIDVAVSESVNDRPKGQVGLNYSHSATDYRSVDYVGEEFSERYSFSYQWPGDRANAEIRIPWASDRIVDIRSVELNGEQYDQWSTDDGELVIDVGSVQSGDVTNVTAVGSKIQVSGAEVRVTDPTTRGADLDSQLEIVETTSDQVSIDVGGTYHVADRDRLIYAPDDHVSWTDPDPRTEITPGEQRVLLDNPISGETTRLRTAAIGSSIGSGDAILRVVDGEDKVRVSPGETEGDTVRLSYHDTVTGDYYRVINQNDQRILDQDQAESPAEFRVTDNSGLLSIEAYVPEGLSFSGGGGGSTGGGLVPTWIWLMVGLVGSVGSLAVINRRTDIGSSRVGRGILLAATGTVSIVGIELVTEGDLTRDLLFWISEGLSGLFALPGAILSGLLDATSNLIGGAVAALAAPGFGGLLLGAALIIGLIVINQRTGLSIPRWGWAAILGLTSIWFIEFVSPGALDSVSTSETFASVVIALVVPLGLVVIDQRTSISIPIPLYAGAALIVSLVLLESLAPGGIVEPLGAALDEVGPLIWIALIGGSIGLLYIWLRSRRPEIIIGGSGGNQGGRLR